MGIRYMALSDAKIPVEGGLFAHGINVFGPWDYRPVSEASVDVPPGTFFALVPLDVLDLAREELRQGACQAEDAQNPVLAEDMRGALAALQDIRTLEA